MSESKPPRGGSRPGAGRKPTGEPTRTMRIIVLATNDEHARLTARAKGKPVSTYLRERGLGKR